MRIHLTRVLILLVFVLPSAKGWAQQAPHIQPAKAGPAKAPVKVVVGSQLLFGTLPLSTRSLAARQNLEMALDQYENASFEEAIMHAQLATDKDPKFAMGYALWSFAARRAEPAPSRVLGDDVGDSVNEERSCGFRSIR